MKCRAYSLLEILPSSYLTNTESSGNDASLHIVLFSWIGSERESTTHLAIGVLPDWFVSLLYQSINIYVRT